MTHGSDYYRTPLQQMPLSFDVIQDCQLRENDFKKRKSVGAPAAPGEASVSIDPLDSQVSATEQPSYNYSQVQLETLLKDDSKYLVLPSLYMRKFPGTFLVTVHASTSVSIQGACVPVAAPVG